MARPLLHLALLAALPAGGLALATGFMGAAQFFDPCLSFADRPRPPCPNGYSATSETVAGAALRLLLIQGGILAACAVGVVGIARGGPHVAGAGAGLLLVESVPLVFSGVGTVLCLFSAAGILAALRLSPSYRGRATWTAKGVGLVAAVGALLLFATTVRAAPTLPFAWLLPLMLLGVALVPWWPVRA